MCLARTLGGMTVEEMLERISSSELVQWKALYEIETEDKEFNQRKQEMVDSFR